MAKEIKNAKTYIVCAIAFSTIMLFLSLFWNNGILEIMKLNREHKGLANNISAVRNENAKLRDEINKLKTNKRYIEELARKDFGMVKENEIVFIFRE